MIQGWKLAREIDRFGQQLRALGGLVWEPFVQRAHDRRRGEILDAEDGSVPLLTKVALYLLYQPNGLLASTLVTCRHLRDKGYAPLVVSNTPLSREDRDRLNHVCWKSIVRPNYGYDFGGYRDGILSLWDWEIAPERLIILHDSIWFPIGEGETLIDQMEALEADLAGLVIHPGMRRRRFSTKRRAFLESYFYLVNRSVMQHPAYRRYWRNFRVSSNKYNAVYRGERGFSGAMAQAQLRVRGVLTHDKLLAALEAQDDSELRKTLRYAAYTDPDFKAENAMMLGPEAPEDWREKVLDHMRRVMLRRNFHASFPYASIRFLDAQYLKKGTGTFLKRTYGTLHKCTRQKYLQAVAAGDLPHPNEDVLNEILLREGFDPREWLDVSAGTGPQGSASRAGVG